MLQLKTSGGAKNLKLKANHNPGSVKETQRSGAKNLKLKANHNVVVLAVQAQVGAKNLKLKANHNSTTAIITRSSGAKNLKLKANHNYKLEVEETLEGAKNLKLKANHNYSHKQLKHTPLKFIANLQKKVSPSGSNKNPPLAMRFTMLLLSTCTFFTACKKSAEGPTDLGQTEGTVSRARQDGFTAAAAFSTTSWTAGTLPATTDPARMVLANDQLKPLGVVLGGASVFKSNNPEIFRGNGWLMQHARTDAARGSRSYGLSGTHPAYFFHINKSGVTKYLHLLVTNPNAGAITVSSKGSCYTNAEKPLTGSGTGQSFFVAKDWLTNTLRQPQTANTSLAQYAAKEIFKIAVANSGMVDGRFEITTSGNAYYYTVITGSGLTSDAITASQSTYAAGDYYTESTNAYGREAGIYQYSEVSADNTLDVPATAAHIGFALNTSNKFSASLENQVASALLSLNGSASKSYGNYGHRYRVTFRLQNNNSISKTVRLYFASNSVNAAQSNATWNGPVKMNGSVINVYTRLNAPRQQLSSWTVAPGAFNVTLEFYVPGLITANQQLIFETN